MPLIITPRQLNQRAELYHQLGIMITAGLTIHKALEHLQTNPPSLSLRAPITQLLEQLDQGHTVSDSVQQLGRWSPSFDLALIDAGERSGRLDACFKLLAVYYRERAQMMRQMMSDMAYPAFLLHFAIFLFPLINLVSTGNFTRFVLMTAGLLLPLYGLVFLIIYACQGRRGEEWRSKLESVLARVPILGTARQDLALARLATALDSLLNAGVPIVTAWELAATASASPALARTVHNWKEPLQNGSTFSELISASGRFPVLFTNLYHTGEVSGTTDQTLIRLHDLYQTEGLSRMKALAQWTPKLVYFGVVFFVAWKIISFYFGYFQEIDKAIDFK
ncbi:MAG: type II secretion system F family protein [Verrucomicrobiota bacterium]|jgi:type II secretory pathway component PulF